MSDDDDFGIVLEEDIDEEECNNKESQNNNTKNTNIDNNDVTNCDVPDQDETNDQTELPLAHQLEPVYEISDIPIACLNEVPCCVGIDEAGRGPVLGPMVYGAAYWPCSENSAIEKLGFNDSKQLLDEQRQQFFNLIKREKNRIGSVICELSAEYLSNKMLLRNPISLNELSYQAAIAMVRKIIQKGVHVAEIFVDAVGNCETYTARLQREFPGCNIVVKPKADALYKVVGAASILAKVTRDNSLKTWVFPENYDLNGKRRKTGKVFQPMNCSGYPSDEKTTTWLRENSDPIFGYPSVVRFSWKTTKALLGEMDLESGNEPEPTGEQSPGGPTFVHVEWENLDKEMQGTQTLASLFQKKREPVRMKYFKERGMKHVTSF